MNTPTTPPPPPSTRQVSHTLVGRWTCPPEYEIHGGWGLMHGCRFCGGEEGRGPCKRKEQHGHEHPPHPHRPARRGISYSGGWVDVDH